MHIGIPAFKRMRMAGFVQADIGFLHFAGNPGAGLPFARRGGAGGNHGGKMAVGAHGIRFVAQGFGQRAADVQACADRAPCAATAPTSKSAGRLNTTGKCPAHKRPASARYANRRPPPPARRVGRWLCAHRESAGFSGLKREYPQQPTLLRPCRTIGACICFRRPVPQQSGRLKAGQLQRLQRFSFLRHSPHTPYIYKA